MRLLLFLLAIGVANSCKDTGDLYDLTIYNISIVDPLHQKIIPHQTITITDRVITQVVASFTDPEMNGPAFINGTGKFAIAGFWDMHSHITWNDSLDKELFPVFLSYGITGIRDMWGDLGILNRFKKQIKQHPSSGPNLYGCGPILDGEDPIHPEFSVALTLQNTRAVLDSLYKGKVDFFKVYSLLPKDVLKEVAAFSRQHKIPFAGHISEYISPMEAVELHQKSFEHLNRIEDLIADSTALRNFIGAVKLNGNWICPTLIVYKRKLDLAQRKELVHPLFGILPEGLWEEWAENKISREQRTPDPRNRQDQLEMYKDHSDLIRTLYLNGSPMLVGSDFGGMAFVYPGYGFHEEMAHLRETGLDTYDSLRMATYDPAVYFGIEESHGTLEKGKMADIVILNKNLVEDIGNTLAIDEVIRAGIRIQLSFPSINEPDWKF